MLGHVLLLTLYLGADPPLASQDIPIELHDGVDVTAEQIRTVKEEAAKAFPGEIDRIYVGQLVHPFSNVGFRVHFTDEVIGTYVIEREFALELPSEKQARGNPAEDANVAREFWSLDSGLVPHGLFTSVKRVFPLKTSRLHLALPDELSYDQVMSLLKAIESRAYRVREEAPSTYSGLDDEINAPRIICVRYNEDAKTIEVETRERRFGGKVYRFAIRPDGFLLLSVAHWVT